MANPDWGTKRTCHSCGAKYYDFKKKAPVCPNCGTAFNPEALLKSRRRAVPEEKPKAPVPEEIEVDTSDVAEGADEVAGVEDTEDLGGDDSEVIEAEGQEDE